jgi:hypothetical protein
MPRSSGTFQVPLVEGRHLCQRRESDPLPITLFEDIHPAIRAGLVDRYFMWPAFWQSVPRHIAFGAVLRVLYDRLRSI